MIKRKMEKKNVVYTCSYCVLIKMLNPHQGAKANPLAEIVNGIYDK